MTRSSLRLSVGNIQVEGDLILAPMDGYSSWPFRSLCRELGSAISYTEFVKSEDVLDRPHYIKEKLYFEEKERPVFFQLYGHNPGRILEAALILQDREPDAIDINLGCPNRSITSRGAGVGLMRNPLKVARIFKNLTKSLEIPITAKIRLGWRDCQNQILIARIIEEFGGSLVTVHARTKEQGHQGEVNIPAIKEIKQTLTIPVIGNGGIQDNKDIKVMHKSTDCDGVMIGRAAISNPWIFNRKDREQIPHDQVKEVVLDHLERSLSFYKNGDGLILFRKFAARYLSPYQLTAETRRALLTETDPKKFKKQLGDIFSDLES